MSKFLCNKTSVLGHCQIFGCILMLSLFLNVIDTSDTYAYSASITTSSSVSLDVLPSGDGISIHEESINIQSNCRNGYNLTVATPSGSSLYNGGNSSNPAAFTAVDGSSALNTSTNTNKWGYTLTADASSSTVFSPFSTTASTLKTTSQTASATNINDTFPIYYGLKVDNTVAPGTYQMANNGAVVYYLTMDATCDSYTVAFNANGGTGTTTEQEIKPGVTAKLNSETFNAPVGASYTDADNNTITGNSDKLWTFWGWNTEVDGTGDWYKDKEEVTDLATTGETFNLYAQWKQATLADLTAGTQVGTEKVIDHNEMQDMRPEVCWNSDITTAANAPAITLLDYRGKVTTGDNPESPESYTVSKLPDNRCWMTRNLNLGRDSGGPNSNGTITLTPDDTDITEDFILPASTNTSNTSSTAARIRTTNNSGNNTNGTYYSWPASVANTTNLSERAIPSTSICPKNWDLPSAGHYLILTEKADYKTDNLTTSAPSSFLTNGGFTNGETFYQTGYSFFWTYAANTSSSANGARVNDTSITTSGSTGTTYGGNRYYLKNIRCVASQGKASISYDGNGTVEHPTTGSITPQTNIDIHGATASSNGFTRTGYSFNGWNTAADGSGESISTGSLISALNIKPGETITLYAQWSPQYTITYVNNCRTYAGTNSSCTQSVSGRTSEQRINLTNDPSTGTETSTLAAYNKWTLTDWKITSWTTNADGTGTTYPVSSTYAVPAGSSAGDGITLYAHWAPIYTIQYDGNGADNPNGMGTMNTSTGIKSVKQINVSEGDPIKLLASNFKRSGFGFAGWSTSPTATVGGTDKIYGPMETIDAPAYPANNNHTITMYAVWVEAKKDGNDNPVYLQDFTTSDCSSLVKTNFNNTTGVITPGSVIALTDKRDNQVYTIAKLADNKCWMIENLRLDDEYTLGQNQNDNSITNQSLSQGYGGTTGTYGNFVGLANSESTSFVFSGNPTANTIYQSSLASPVDTYDPSNNTLEDIGTKDYPGYRLPRYNNANTSNLIDSTTYTQDYANAIAPSSSGTNYPASSNIYGYGNYYNWAAAMANTNYYTSSSDSEVSGTSICPYNWHLPSSGTAAKEFSVLSLEYGGNGDNQNSSIISNRFRSFPNNFLLSGYYYSMYTMSRGSSGTYWSRSAYSIDNSFNLNLEYGKLKPSNTYFLYAQNKSVGFSVRCLIGS